MTMLHFYDITLIIVTNKNRWAKFCVKIIVKKINFSFNLEKKKNLLRPYNIIFNVLSSGVNEQKKFYRQNSLDRASRLKNFGELFPPTLISL